VGLRVYHARYDELGRLTRAETVANDWGQAFSYDGFGNLFAKAATKGSGVPTMNILVDQATNRVAASSGFTYDANGNATAMPGVGLAYDIDNRVKSTTNSGGQTEQYRYGADNRRLRIQRNGGAYEYFFYDIDGSLVGVFDQVADGGTQKLAWKSMHVSVGGRLCWTGGFDAPTPVVTDRLSSVVLRGTTRVRTLPYGEEWGGATANDKEKFATYWRDASTGLDYAHNRSYGSTLGRFNSADPYQASGGAAEPTSWNRYIYVMSDPVNYLDSSGLQAMKPTFKVTTYADTISHGSEIWWILNYINTYYSGGSHAGGGSSGGPSESAPPSSRRTSMDRLFSVAATALQAYAVDFADRLRNGDISEACMRDIVALEIDPEEWASALEGLSIELGIGSNEPYYLHLAVGSEERATAQDRNLTIGDNFGSNSTVVAISSANTNQVWINPRLVNPGERSRSSALIAHEALHKLGPSLTDQEIQRRLGLEVGAASANIGGRLAASCFSGPSVH
jgi:RHS repeat-associated protein